MMEPQSFLRLFWYLFGSALIACFGAFERAHAYIPRTKTILERTTKNHGRGLYQIQLELLFRTDNGNSTITETWLVEHGESLYLQAAGSNFSYTATYKGKQKFFVDENGSERAQKLSSEFFEGLFHYRSAESLGQAFVQLGALPSKALNFAKINSLKDAHYPREPFIRLARTGGTISYTFGKPTPNGSPPFPGVWIQQDQFTLKKIRLPGQSEVISDDYNEFRHNLHYPRSRSVLWGGKSVNIRTLRVIPVSATQENKNKLSAQYLKSQPASSLKARLGNNPFIKDFYQRYR